MDEKIRIDGPSALPAAVQAAEARKAEGGRASLFEVSNGYIVKTGGRLWGVRREDFGSLQQILAGGDGPPYSAPAEAWCSGGGQTGQLPPPDLMRDCRGIMIIHQLENCVLVAGHAGVHLASAPANVAEEMGRMFVKL